MGDANLNKIIIGARIPRKTTIYFPIVLKRTIDCYNGLQLKENI